MILNPVISINGEVHSSKNSRRIFRNKKTGNSFIAKSAASKADEKTFSQQLTEQKGRWDKFTEGMPYPLFIVFRFRRASHRIFDYVNLAQGILDAMVKARYFPDDCMKYVIPLFEAYTVNKENPGCDISVYDEVTFSLW